MKPFASYLVMLGGLTAASPASGSTPLSPAVATFDLTPGITKHVPLISIKQNDDATVIDCHAEGPVVSIVKFYDNQGRLIGKGSFIAHKNSTALHHYELRDAAVMRIQLLR